MDQEVVSVVIDVVALEVVDQEVVSVVVEVVCTVAMVALEVVDPGVVLVGVGGLPLRWWTQLACLPQK